MLFELVSCSGDMRAMSLSSLSRFNHSLGWFGKPSCSVLPILENPIALSKQLPRVGGLARSSDGKALLVVVLLAGHANLF